jgi:hypothetical protein
MAALSILKKIRPDVVMAILNTSGSPASCCSIRHLTAGRPQPTPPRIGQKQEVGCSLACQVDDCRQFGPLSISAACCAMVGERIADRNVFAGELPME